MQISSTGNVGIGTTPSYKLHVVDTATSTFPTNGIGTYVKGTATPNADASSGQYRGFAVDAYKTGANNLTGTTKVIGMELNADNTGTGSVASMYGARFGMYNEGTGTITNAYTNYLLLSAGAGNPITTAYGLYIDTHKKAGVTTAYSLYQVGASDLNYFAGFTGFGTATAPATPIHVIKTTEQLRLGYDASNYLSATVSSTGSTTFALTGTTPIFTFSQGVTFSAGITLSTQNIVTDTTTGTKIGPAVGQKLAFWNATPVVQQAHIADATGGATVDTEARAAIASNNALLATLGLTASA
jgi:hypothetical protein